jgi:hypothetical protein
MSVLSAGQAFTGGEMEQDGPMPVNRRRARNRPK